MIANYFGDTNTPDCEICDNCINNKAVNLSDEEFKIISEKIIALLKIENQTIQQIIFKLKPTGKRIVWKVISFLLTEEVIENDISNKLRMKA